MSYFIIFLVSMFVWIMPAGAAENNFELEEIVVTASRVSEQIKDAPVTVNVLSTQELDKIKARNPENFLSRLPGINSSNFGGESELTAIRVPTHFTNPYTLVLIDGIPTSSYGSGSSGQLRELNSNNIARIEVLKGPASALYGSNAIGGIINVITKEPSAEPEASLWTELGDYNQWRSGFSGSSKSGPLSFNINLNHIDTESARQNNSSNKKSGTIKMNYLPTDESFLTFKADYTTQENDSPGTIKEAAFDSDWQQSYQTFTYNKQDRFAPAISYSRYFNDSEFRAIVALRDTEDETIPNYRVSTKSQTDSLDANFQILYSKDIPFWRSKIITGWDVEHGSKDSLTYNLTTTQDGDRYISYAITTINSSYDITTKLSAPYLQIETSPTEKLRFSAGGRYDRANYEVDTKHNTDPDVEKSFSKFSPKIGATYHVAPTLDTYVSYSKGFVVPTTSQLWTSTYANADIDAEKAENYEIGFRSNFWQKRAKVDCSFYTMDITDKIVTNDTKTAYVNAGEATQKGVEVLASVIPLDYARLAVAYTFAKNKYDKYVSGGIDYTDNWQPRSPKHHLNARLTLLPIDNLEIELEMDEVSMQYADDANDHEYSRPTLFNLRAQYDWRNFSFWGHILNLADKEYAAYVSTVRVGASYVKGLYSGAPRTAFVGVSYKFGGDK